MDPLRFRKRRLFRQQALDAFVGAFGHGSMPDVIRPPPGPWLRHAVLALGLGWVVWLGTAALLGSETVPLPPDARQESAVDG